MADCKVCWTCRGLFTSKKMSEKMPAHIKSCNGSHVMRHSDFFKYFVCDRVDYNALTNLKKCLSKDGRRAISSNRAQAVLPQSIIKALLALCTHGSPLYKFKKSLFQSTCQQQENKDTGSHKKFRIDTSKHQIFQLNKECQTTLEVSHADIRNTDSETCFVTSNDHTSSGSLIICDHESSKSGQTDSNIQLQTSMPRTDAPADSVAESDQVMTIASGNILDKEKELQRQEEMQLKAQCDVIIMNQESLFVCKLCSHKSKFSKLMLRHLKSHNEGQSFECSDCLYSTIWRQEWKQHLDRKHKAQKFHCQFCTAKFSRKNKFEQHILTHPDCAQVAEKSRLKCDECEYSARDATSLKEHKRKHTGELLTCPHDGCMFKSMYERSLNKHLQQKHSKEKTQVCYICGFQTRHPSSLSKHIMLHEKIKPYKCAYCSFVAMYPSEVVSHAKNKHLKQKRFSCPVCQFQTSYSLAIKKHVERHKADQFYTCSVCGKGMESMSKVKRHMEKEHGCAVDNLVHEPIEHKVKANDFRIATTGENHLEDSYHVVMANIEAVEKETAETKEMNVTTKAENNLHIVNDLTISAEPGKASQNLMSQSLKNESDLYGNSSQPSKGGNPMLSATSNDLGDTDNSLIEDSLFDLMSDFPRPPALNRSQSASTLMFASFSPHVIDRAMTPDFFFTDSPSVGSFFPNFPSKNLDSESLTLGNLANFDQPSQSATVPPSSVGHLALSSSSLSIRGTNTPSPILPNFIVPSVTGSVSSFNTGGGRDIDSVLPSSVISLSQLSTESGSECPIEKTRSSFVAVKSTFGSLNQFSSEMQTSIHSPEDCASGTTQNCCLNEESPFPTNTVL